MYSVAIKSGTSGWYDHDGCDCIIAKIPSDKIPQLGAILELTGAGVKEQRKYLVTEVKHTLRIPDGKSNYDFGEWVYVYVICIS